LGSEPPASRTPQAANQHTALVNASQIVILSPRPAEIGTGSGMAEKRIGEPQYEEVVDAVRKRGLERLGLMTSWAWYDDPKRLAFTLARYKFVAKMLEGAEHVLEAGCGDGFGSRVVAQAVGALTAVDFDPEFIASATEVAGGRRPVEYRVHDFMAGPVGGNFDGIYSLDVL
jgi:SAM-dependent methyltransferase